jgi:predicted transglutaminase-like cysteine proteinase
LEGGKMSLQKYKDKLLRGEKLTNRELAIYYNYKYKREKVRYWGRGIPKRPERVETDIRNFITPRNYLIKNIIKSLKLKGLSNDAKADKIQKWIFDNLTYVYDRASTGFIEYWQFPYETLHLRTGDCEDGAILMVTLMIAAGIPKWRVRVAGGLVATGQATAPTGGHAWTCYLRESDDKWVGLDWCYLPDLSPMPQKKTLKENKNYIKTFFSWNSGMCWANEMMEFETLSDLINE